MSWMHKKIMQREFLIEVYGPIFVGEYGFSIKFYDGLYNPEIFNSHTNKVVTMKSFKLAQETASFAGTQLHKIATSEFKGKAEYYEQLRQLTETINSRLNRKTV
jgi:hypothetical protein